MIPMPARTGHPNGEILHKGCRFRTNSHSSLAKHIANEPCRARKAGPLTVPAELPREQFDAFLAFLPHVFRAIDIDTGCQLDTAIFHFVRPTAEQVDVLAEFDPSHEWSVEKIQGCLALYLHEGLGQELVFTA
ncbi:hypothetical protein [Pseudonocardia sp. T1-2H]|uniref:hypothetical protein n=1 Tax=Pseudonocardia sp. T1-2H TaxID=3128899 RepID=UPI003100EDF7